jgi:hypothetical protein
MCRHYVSKKAGSSAQKIYSHRYQLVCVISDTRPQTLHGMYYYSRLTCAKKT